MLRSLEIRDLVVLRRAEIEPSPGLTAITGESGAGKTVLAQSLGLLLGESADSKAVRPGAKNALVQATLAMPDGFFEELGDEHPAAGLRELLEADDEAAVARRVPREGRARALLDGQAAPKDAVAALVAELVRVSGQGDSRRLLGRRAQLDVLDAFAGEGALGLARELRQARRLATRAERALSAARARAAETARQRDDLEQMLADIDAVAPDPEEEASLRTERDRLRHGARLQAAAGAAAETIVSEDPPGALDSAGRAAAALRDVVDLDAGLRPHLSELEEVGARLQEAGLGLRAYLEDLEAEPGRLDAVEARLEEYDRLSRRYGPGIDAVLARAADGRAQLADAAELGNELDQLAHTRAAELARARDLAGELRLQREQAAPRLAVAATDELGALAMPQAELTVELSADESDDPPRDRCDMWLRVNPGLPAAPLAEAASGGELSRLLLALHGVAAGAGRETWIFDEVDAGVGGETAGAVAERLARLAEGRQVVVITHLPQVAALADTHYRLVKGLDEQRRTETRVEPIAAEGVVDELCRMLGARSADAGARRHAEELLARRSALAGVSERQNAA